VDDPRPEDPYKAIADDVSKVLARRKKKLAARAALPLVLWLLSGLALTLSGVLALKYLNGWLSWAMIALLAVHGCWAFAWSSPALHSLLTPAGPCANCGQGMTPAQNRVATLDQLCEAYVPPSSWKPLGWVVQLGYTACAGFVVHQWTGDVVLAVALAAAVLVARMLTAVWVTQRTPSIVAMIDLFFHTAETDTCQTNHS
jgi:hypothetical protein